jgi:TBC1 domain family member 2
LYNPTGSNNCNAICCLAWWCTELECNDRIPTNEYLLAVLRGELTIENYTMKARSPPARPHIGIYPSFGVPAPGDWGEDDAWDSASDSESPRQSSISRSWNRPSPPTSTTAPKAVPRPTNNSSSSNLAFSYTHITAPNPSSYPREEIPLAPRSGWTLIKKAQEKNKIDAVDSIESGSFVAESSEGPGDVDVEGDMVITDMESEVGLRDQTTSVLYPRSKLKENQNFIREDVDDIVHGAWNQTSFLSHQHRYSQTLFME